MMHEKKSEIARLERKNKRLEAEVAEQKAFVAEMNDMEAYRDKQKMADLQSEVERLEEENAMLRNFITVI